MAPQQLSAIETATMKKVAWRILPLAIVAYCVAYIDRSNVAFAALTMNKDLGLSAYLYGWGAGIFFFGYFIFEVPSNVILEKTGARIWIARIMLTWGIISAASALAVGPKSFLAIRFLLGAAEAGFFPGMILYLTYWFPAHRRAAMVALLMAGNPVSGIIGGPLSGFIMQHFAGSKGMAGWQWLFILEAIPAILLGAVIFLFLDNRVVEAKWLSERERAAVASEIHEEAVLKSHVSIRSVFTSPRVWLFGAIFFGMEMGSYAIGFWQPTIIRQTGVKDPFHIGMLTTVPYTCALICMMFVGRHSDRTRERRWHIIVPNILAAIGFILCTQAGSNTPIAMFGLVLAVAGVITGLAMFWALPTSFLGGNAAAAGIALINCTGNLGGFFSPAIIGFLKTYTGTLNSGLFLVAACMIASSVLILTLTPAKSPTFQPTGAEI
jgi:D-galactonate transporter